MAKLLSKTANRDDDQRDLFMQHQLHTASINCLKDVLAVAKEGSQLYEFTEKALTFLVASFVPAPSQMPQNPEIAQDNG